MARAAWQDRRMHLLRSHPLASVVVLGVVLVLVGGAWFVGSDFGAAGPATIGWFAYAPLSDTTFSGDGVVALSTSGRNALVLLGLGALLLSAAGGYVLGRRHAAHPSTGAGPEND